MTKELHVEWKPYPDRKPEKHGQYLVTLGSPMFEEALQKPLFPSRIEQNCSVRFFFTTSKKWCFFCH